MSEHSPAPWIADGPPDNIHILQANAPHMRVCFMTSNGPTEANAGLIAAAPELLAGCVAMLGYMEKGFLVRNTAGDNEDDWALKALAFVKDIQAMHAAVAKATGAAP